MIEQLKTWTTKTGKILNISDMKTEHIINCIDMMYRNGYIEISTYEFYFTCDLLFGDMAQLAFDEECESILDRVPSKKLDWLLEELEKRGVNK